MVENFLTILIGVVVIIFVGVVLAFIFTSRSSKRKASKGAQTKTAELDMNLEAIDLENVLENVNGDSSYLQLVMDDDQVYHLELPATLGRSAANTFEIDDDSVSSQHAIIRFDPHVGSICIEDLNSLNGIFVDGRPTIKNVLVDGARITVGGVSFTFRDTGYLPPNR